MIKIAIVKKQTLFLSLIVISHCELGNVPKPETSTKPTKQPKRNETTKTKRPKRNDQNETTKTKRPKRNEINY